MVLFALFVFFFRSSLLLLFLFFCTCFVYYNSGSKTPGRKKWVSLGGKWGFGFSFLLNNLKNIGL